MSAPTKPAKLSMQEFYAQAGELLESRTVEVEQQPYKYHVSEFIYSFGVATFDGSRWGFTVTPYKGSAPLASSSSSSSSAQASSLPLPSAPPNQEGTPEST